MQQLRLLSGGQRRPLGGAEASRQLQRGIRDASSLAVTAVGASRVALFSVARKKIFWYAQLHPGSVHVTFAKAWPNGQWLLGVVGFGIGRHTVVVEGLEDLPEGIQVPMDILHLMNPQRAA